MAGKKKTNPREIITEQDRLYFLKMIMAKMSFDVAKNMIQDLGNEDKRTPALYNSCIKFLEQNEITFDKIATAKEDDGMDEILISVQDEFDTMLLEYDTFGSV